MSRQKVEVVIHDSEKAGYGNSVPSKLNEAIDWLQQMREKIPQEFRSQARLHLDSEPDYDDCTKLVVKITYQRVENDDEFKTRIAAEQRVNEERRKWLQQELARLK